MSTEHDVRVIRIGAVERHDNADTLSITEVDGRPVIIRTGEYQPGDLAVYVPIDSLVPVSDARFAFLAPKGKDLGLDSRARIKAIRLRGVFSMGLLVKPDVGMVEGDEVREALGIDVYEPDASQRGHGPGGSFVAGDAVPGPDHLVPCFDVESARKYRHLLVDGEEVVLTEKVHGANARFVYLDGALHVGSRKQWKGSGMWCDVAARYGLAESLADYPGIILFGEIYGQVQDLKYGRDDHALVLFDAMDANTRRFLDYDKFAALAEILTLPTAPVLYRGPWSAEKWPEIKALAEGSTVIGSGVHTREGWVLRPTVERTDRRLGRVCMKFVGEGYLTRKAA